MQKLLQKLLIGKKKKIKIYCNHFFAFFFLFSTHISIVTVFTQAEDNVRTKQWYTQLQYHAQGMGGWRKRRNALANIMINGMLARS